jgi:hypothetical protein
MEKSAWLNMLDEENWIKTDYGYFYKREEIKFIKLETSNSLHDILKLIGAVELQERLGVICNFLSEDDYKLLRQHKISYIVNNQEMKIFGKNEGPSFQLKKELSTEMSATLIVSPTGLEIVDTLLKLPRPDLLEKTPTKFCDKFELSRPKLSHLMKAFKVHTLFDLKNEILKLDTDWWLKAFNTPVTKRKMTPFQTKKTRRYAFKLHIDDFGFRDCVKKLKDKELDVEVGGLSYLKTLGSIRTDEFDLVVRSDQMIDVIEVLNLRPVKKGEWENIIFLTPIDGSLKKERFVTRIDNYEMRFNDRLANNLNPLRYLWGLNHDESRVREERRYLLETYLNEAKNRND